MPELPEVETIARFLRNSTAFTSSGGSLAGGSVIGRVIRSVELLWERTLAEPLPAEVNTRLVGQEIREVDRRGKFLVLELSRGWLLFHLRMSGDIRVEQESATCLAHDRVIFHFGDDTRLVFNDTRKFGRIWAVDDPQSVVGGLGPEPLGNAFSAELLHQMLRARSRELKPLLMDQAFLAGLGNIYTDEALHRAGLHPRRRSSSLKMQESERLYQAIREVLEEGIRRNGASIDWVYRGGEFQNYFRVYQRQGQVCTTCGTKIERIVVGQRGTRYCPKCQPL
ncbi:MAG TPA: bifunctional DNA-formamidopyrimidine glycosylase/DNA-(apurinic or apyrimidinic site) lyase [Anaerolineaceae bacterium]|nr:bifunctional DNA-formamidopyrimidine glycosylase/DNA-(apurinic or apyrimidinic site) lyase [Anaerolineaceae bacterium]